MKLILSEEERLHIAKLYYHAVIIKFHVQCATRLD